MARILVTRPADEAVETRRRLELLGHEVIVSPVMESFPVTSEVPEKGRSLVLTSKNAVRYGLTNLSDREWEVFCVGAATAEAARDEGFHQIITGPGTAKGLTRLLIENAKGSMPRKYNYLCGSEISYNITDALTRAGVDATDTIVYLTRPASALTEEARAALEMGRIDAALFYSPRSATVFEEIIADHGLMDLLGSVRAFALSSRVAENLLGPWAEVHRSLVPTEHALFEILNTAAPAVAN